MNRPDFVVFVSPAAGRDARQKCLRRAAELYLGAPAGDLRIEIAAGGKPFFPGLSAVRFSLSHSGDYWACAFGPAEVGLDVQRHQESDIRLIASRFFHPEEDKYLRERAYRREDFFSIWTAKEALVKYTGEGLTRGLENFSVLSPCGWAEIREIPFLPGYSMCVCAEKIGAVSLRYM